MLKLDGGRFWMGTEDVEGFPLDGEGPVREVTLDPFYLDAHPVTNQQFREFVRVNNIGNLNYVGSVIVGDTNSRFFEPAATRNFIVGVSVNVSL